MAMHRKLYLVRYAMEHHLREQTCGGMDSEPTGVCETRVHECHVVAPDEHLAAAVFGHGMYDVREVVEVADNVRVVDQLT